MTDSVVAATVAYAGPQKRVFVPGTDHVTYLLGIADRLAQQADDATQIGRDYRDHAQMLRVEVHRMLCLTYGIGHVLCRKGMSNCPVYLEAVRLAEQAGRRGDAHE